MFRHLALAACVAYSATASAITPDTLPNYGPVQNDAGNARFLDMLPLLNAAFATPPAGQPGSAFIKTPGFGNPGYDVRIWFVSQDAGYHNALGITETFNDASSGRIAFGDSHALNFGDYVDVPIGPSGLFLPFVLADYNASQLEWYGLNNADSLSHIEFSFVLYDWNKSFWWAVSIDDQFGGGDRDFNDLRLALEFTQREQSLSASIATPEPGTWAMVVGFAAIVGLLWRRRCALA